MKTNSELPPKAEAHRPTGEMDRRGFLGKLGVLTALTLPTFQNAEVRAQLATTNNVASTNTAPAGPQAGTKTATLSAQNSVDISTLYLGQGQLTFRSDNTPITIDKNQRDPSKKPVVAPMLAVSEGTFIQAVAIGLESIRKNNQGQLPPNATFRLLVSSRATALPTEFSLDTAQIPAEKDLTQSSVILAAGENSPAFNYVKNNLCVNVTQLGLDHLQSSFALRSNRKVPAYMYIIMDLPQQQLSGKQ
jgi:hypothetical protein